MTVKLAVWAMIVSSTLALIAVFVFVFAHLDFVVGWAGLPSGTVQEVQGATRHLVGKAFPAGNFEAWLGSINMAFQAMNAVVTFLCSKFVNKNLPVVAEANGQWHWVSYVTSLNDKDCILRVKIGDMTVTNVHDQNKRETSPGEVISGHDFEMDGQPLSPAVGFNATDVIVGTLGTERIIFWLCFLEDASAPPLDRRRKQSGFSVRRPLSIPSTSDLCIVVKVRRPDTRSTRTYLLKPRIAQRRQRPFVQCSAAKRLLVVVRGGSIQRRRHYSMCHRLLDCLPVASDPALTSSQTTTRSGPRAY